MIRGLHYPQVANINFGNNLTDGLKDVNYPNSNVKLFNVTETTESQAESLLKQRTVDAELIIPQQLLCIHGFINSLTVQVYRPQQLTKQSPHQ